MSKKELIKKECIEKMELLNISKEVIDYFKKLGGVMCYVETENIIISLPKELEKIKEEIETKGGMVYYAIDTMSHLGELVSFLYTSSFEEEWEEDRIDLRNNVIFSYIYNVDNPELSTFGTIKILEKNGKISRIK